MAGRAGGSGLGCWDHSRIRGASLRWIVGLISVLLMLVLIAVGAVALIPTDQVASLAAAQFQRLTGRTLQLEGGVEPTFWPVLGVRTGPVRIDNADWAEEGPMLTADALDISLDMADLMAGTITITAVEMVKPALVLERAADGRANWEFGGGGAGGEVSAATPGVGRAYTLGRAVIRDGSLRFVDHASGRRVVVDGIDAEGAIPDFDGAATLSATARVQGQPIRLVAEVGVFSDFTEGRVVPVTLQAEAGGSTLRFDGRAGHDPMAAEGRLQADLSDLAAVATLAGAEAPAFPKAARVEGALTLAKSGVLSLRQGGITADGTTIRGDIDLTPGTPRARLVANLTAGVLTLPGAAGTGDGAAAGQGGQAVATGGWSQAPIDVSALGAIDAEVGLTAEGMVLGPLRLGASRLKMTLERSRAVFDLRRIDAYGGVVTGQFVVNGRGGLSSGGDLTFAGIAMQPLLSDTAGWDRLIANGDLRLKFLAVGNSVDALMRSVKGDGSLSLGKGELRGLDIAGMLRNLDPGFVGEGQKTIFDGVTASFAMADGVLSNDDLSLSAPYVTATGAGTVGLGSRTLDYRLRPLAMARADGSGGVLVPLVISGTWAAPKFRLDLEAIARERMEAEAKALEARAKEQAKAAEAEAKARLEEKLREELGVTAGEGESLEDAVRRRAGEALDAEAGRLLEGLLGGN